MRKLIAVLVALLAAACSGPAEVTIQDHTELDVPADLVDIQGDLGRSEQAVDVPQKFCWDASSWDHGRCNYSDDNAQCYCPRFTDEVAVWFDQFSYQSNPVLAEARSGIFQYDSDLGIDPAVSQYTTNPKLSYSGQIVRLNDKPWDIGVGPLESLDQPQSVRVYCYGSLSYIGRVFGYGARIYTCREMGIDLDSQSANVWRYLSGSNRTTGQIYSALLQHAFGAALGQPTDPDAPWGSNAMLPFIDDNVIGAQTFDPCQKARAQVFDGSGPGAIYTAVACGL